MKTREIKEEFYTLQKMLENEEFDEETGELIDNSKELQELLSEIEDSKADKADSIAFLVNQAKESQNNLKAEIDRLNARKKMFLNQENSLKQLLDFLLSGEKMKTDLYTFSYRNPQSVNITDESLIPSEFLNVKEVITPNKKLIKEALANFDEVAGAEIVVSKSLSVK